MTFEKALEEVSPARGFSDLGPWASWTEFVENIENYALEPIEESFKGGEKMEVNFDRVFELVGANASAFEQKTGLTRGSIYNWKKGVNKPSVIALVKIAEYFKVSVDYLLGRSDW